MKNAIERIRMLDDAACEERLRTLYGDGQLAAQKERYAELVRRHEESFGETEKLYLVSAPGRTEIGGNHTDHNHGRVLAASVNLDALCAVSRRDDLKALFYSEGYDPVEIDLSDLSARPEETGTTAALIRGVAAGMQQAGYRIGGKTGTSEKVSLEARTGEKEYIVSFIGFAPADRPRIA